MKRIVIFLVLALLVVFTAKAQSALLTDTLVEYPLREMVVDFGNDVKLELVLIQPGKFWMGSNNGRGSSKPLRKVELTKAYWIGKFEITKKVYNAVYGISGGDQNPAGLSRINSLNFAKAIADITKLPFRILTEAEHVHARMAGTNGNFWWPADKWQEYAWFSDNAFAVVQEVGLLKPNPWGLYDICGNVHEYVSDITSANGYPSNLTLIDPIGVPNDGAIGKEGISVGGAVGDSYFNGNRGWNFTFEGNNGRTGTRICLPAPELTALILNDYPAGTAYSGDFDNDGIKNDLDNCPLTPNVDQKDTDGDKIGDVCDADFDNDNDGVLNEQDNCPNTANPFQEDLDGDGVGDICDASPDDILLTIMPTTNGTVIVNPVGTTQLKNSTVTLTAKPAVGYKFNGWSGDFTGIHTVSTIIMEAHKTVSASFVKTNSFAINCGGDQYIAADGTVYAQTTAGYSKTNTITGTTDQFIYQSERSANAPFSYDLPVDNGDYTVVLKFAEVWFTASAERVFNVAIEGTPVLTNFDIFVDAGGANKVIDKTFKTTVTDGILNIAFTSVVNNAKISAIKVSNDQETSIKNINGNSAISVYPNPATDKIYINAGGQIITKTQLIDVTGKVVFSSTNITDFIDLSTLSNGMYILKAYTQQGVVSTKITKI